MSTPKTESCSLCLRAILILALLALPLTVMAQFPTQSIGWETCEAGLPVQSLSCAGIAEISTASGEAIAVDFNGRFGSTGKTALFSDSGALTIQFSTTVSRVTLDLLDPSAGSSLRAFDSADNELDADVVGATANVAAVAVIATGISRVVIDDPQGEFGIDQLEFDPETPVAGCPADSDGCLGCIDEFTIGGFVNGLAAGNQVVLQNNGTDDLPVTSNGDFVFDTPVVDGGNYVVAVAVHPDMPSQTCTVSNGTGTLAGADVDDVQVVCSTDSFTIGGTVSGLEGSGLVLALNGQSLTVNGNGAFSFPDGLPDLSTYVVSVQTQPGTPSQTCTVSNGTGTLAGGDVDDVQVDCSTDSFNIGGTVSGLEGSGLVLALEEQSLTINEDGSFSFPEPLTDQSDYEVTVVSQPVDPDQLCRVTDGTGTLDGADVLNVTVTCFLGDIFRDRFMHLSHD